QISFVEITKLGQNALDFQLCTLMGMIIGQFEGDALSIYIVSKDTGYDSVRDGIPLLLEQELQQRELALSISRITCIRDSLKKPAKKVKAKKLPPAESKAEWKEVRKALKGTEYQKNLGKILDIIRESAKKNHNLSKIYAGFVAEWGEEAGGELYRLIRRELKKDLK
ncbi:MAG: PIN domain-containing protein, partial [Butyricicoccaceae bacterium]